MQFWDRENDIQRLRTALGRERNQFIVLYGRRRIGKSTLIHQVLDVQMGDIYFLADKTSESNQRRLFSSMVDHSIPDFSLATYSNWETLLVALSRQLGKRITVCLDEFPYLVKSCPALPSILQKLLDSRTLTFNLILCGSSQQMMQGMVLDSKEPLYGRADEIIRLQPIPPHYMERVLGCRPQDAVREYAVWGGIPRYWELRKDYSDYYEAISHLLLDSHGVLYDEPPRLLQDEMRDTIQASTILSVIGNGANKLSEIASRCERQATDITPQLSRLRELGFINKQVPFGEDVKKSRKGLYYISDPLLRFHYRFVQPFRSVIEMGNTDVVMSLFKSQENSYVSYCWEELCRRFVTGSFIGNTVYGKADRWWGSYFDSKENRYKEAELDVVAESIDHQHLLIGECKWTEKEDTSRVLARLEQVAKGLPFVKQGQSVHLCLFLKEEPVKTVEAHVFLPQDVMGR